MSRHSTNPWVVLVIICLAQFMVVLDATIVNVALPSIQKDLGLSEANLQWIINAYTLVFGGFLLLGGRAASTVCSASSSTPRKSGVSTSTDAAGNFARRARMVAA